MNLAPTRSPVRTALISIVIALAFAGCKSKPATDDANIAMQVQARLFGDQNLSGQNITASAADGVVILTGNVTSDTARTLASGDAAQVAGVKTVVDNLVVQAQTVPIQVTVPPPPPMPAERPRKPSASVAQTAPNPVVGPQPAPQPAPIVRNEAPPSLAQAQPPQQQTPPPPARYQQPVVHTITLPVGTDIPVRVTQTLDSATTQTGDKFTGAIASDIIVDGMVVLSQGTPVTGHVDAVQDAAHFKGASLLTISLSAIDRHGERIQVATDPFTKQGEGRGKNTAEKIGGGAAVGAILGGIFGGGKGAAIGAAAGGGVGAGANGVTRGQRVQIPSETVVRFKLSTSILVHVSSKADASGNYSPELEHHDP